MTKKTNWLFNPYKKNDDANTEVEILPLFASPVMKHQLDLDVEKLTEWSFQLQKDKKTGGGANRGGWQSKNIADDPEEEFIKLKKEITHYLHLYQSEIFQGVEFKVDVAQRLANLWVNINGKHHYNDWHTHFYSTLSGVFYIKHDGAENGNILFKHSNHPETGMLYWPPTVKSHNLMTTGVLNITPKTNMLLIFPSWLNHSVESNLKQDSRISLSFNSQFLPEKNNG